MRLGTEILLFWGVNLHTATQDSHHVSVQIAETFQEGNDTLKLLSPSILAAMLLQLQEIVYQSTLLDVN